MTEEDEEGEKTDESGKTRAAFTKGIRCPKIPKRRRDVRDFHMDLIDEVLKVSTRRDEKEKDFF